jgi:8-oxo-dGTP pyrophosphatase MutT (NUDIX family)
MGERNMKRGIHYMDISTGPIISKSDLKLHDEEYQGEMVDVVDEDNNILYKTSKKKTHEFGLLHRTVIAEVIDSKGKWTLVKQASDRQDADQYVSPVGGHVRSGESEDEALHREALEEMGLKDFDYKYIGKVIFNRKILGRQENHYFILYEIYTDDKPELNHESVGLESFSKQQLATQIKANPKKFGEAFYFIVNTFYPELMG